MNTLLNITQYRGFSIRTYKREDGDIAASIRPEYELTDIQPTEDEVMVSAKRQIDQTLCKQQIATRLPMRDDHSLVGTFANLRVQLFQLESAVLFHNDLLKGWDVDIRLGVYTPRISLWPKGNPIGPVVAALSSTWTRIDNMLEGRLIGFEEVTVFIHDAGVEAEEEATYPPMIEGECPEDVRLAATPA